MMTNSVADIIFLTTKNPPRRVWNSYGRGSKIWTYDLRVM